MQCRDIILEMAEEKKDQRQSSAVVESQRDACCDDGDQQADDSLAQDVEKKLTIEHRQPKVDEPQSHAHQHSTIVCDAWYGLPTQKRPRRERVNAIARQLRNVEQSALLATTKTAAANNTGASSTPGCCGVRVVLVGKESDVQIIGERLEKLREEDGGTNGESSCGSCRVEVLPNVTVSEACGTLRTQDDEPASTANDDAECHDKPIYLSPDADTTLDPRKPPPRTVVVGMLIDRRVQPNRSSERATKIDVPAARLPMDELKVEGLETNEALNVDTVLEMMVCWWNNVDGLHVGGGNAGGKNDDVDDNGNSFRRCFIAAASAAMVSHEDRHPNRAIHGAGS